MKLFFITTFLLCSPNMTNASSTMSEADFFLSSLDKVQKMNGDKGCSNIKITRNEFRKEIHYYLQIGDAKVVYLLTPYSLDSIDLDTQAYVLNYTLRGSNSSMSPYPSRTTKIILEKESQGQLSSLEYSFVEKSGPFTTTQKIKTKCTR